MRACGGLPDARHTPDEADDGVENLGGWLTTVVGRVCLDMLRSRASRREVPFTGVEDEPVLRQAHGHPEFEAETFAGRAQAARPALVDGAPGAAWVHAGQTQVAFGFTVVDGRITEIELLADPDALSEGWVQLA